MQNLPQQRSPIEDKIIEMSLELGPKEIAEKVGTDLKEVFQILSTPEAQMFRENKLQIMNNELQYKRIEKANSLVVKLMEGIEILVNQDPNKWKLPQVKLFELLLKDIPEQLKNIRQIKNIQVNNYNQIKFDSDVEKNLDQMMDSLPADLKMEFWTEVETLAKQYVKKYQESSNAKSIQEVRTA